jgi:hypothetical protein
MILSPFFKKTLLVAGIFTHFAAVSFGMECERFVSDDGIMCESYNEEQGQEVANLNTSKSLETPEEDPALFQQTSPAAAPVHFLMPVVFIPINPPIIMNEALWSAARYGDCQFILSAVQQGLVAVDAIDRQNHNRTALMEAARIGKLQACYQLTGLGANKFLMDRIGNTAFGCAVLGHVYRTANADQKNDFFLYPCVKILQLLLDFWEYECECVIFQTLKQTSNEQLHESGDFESCREVQKIVANRILDNVYHVAVTGPQARPEVLRCIAKERAFLNSDWDEVIRLLD